MDYSILNKLEQQITCLIEICSTLQNENDTLRTKYTNLLQERSVLQEKNKHSAKQIKAVVQQIKSFNVG